MTNPGATSGKTRQSRRGDGVGMEKKYKNKLEIRRERRYREMDEEV